jgi:Helix-turn-helix domain
MDVKIYTLQPFDPYEFIRNEVFVTSEAIELLGISRARMSVMIKQGKIEPVKRFGSTSLFLRDDLIRKKEQLEELRRLYRPQDYE